MKKLIEVLEAQIVNQIKLYRTNIIRIESIDNPVIYAEVCKQLEMRSGIDSFIPKLTKQKYNEFLLQKNHNWDRSLEFLYKGKNDYYSDQIDEKYSKLSYVDLNNAITKWRNESSNSESDKTTLILLLGTEAAPDDAGSLMDTSYVISPKEIIHSLSRDYSSWFKQIMATNNINTPELSSAIHTVYRSLFSSINIDIFKLSNYVDSLATVSFSDEQEMISTICESLNEVWGIPSIKNSKYIPKFRVLAKGKVSSAKIISDAIKFINRDNELLTNGAIKKLNDKCDLYVKENSIDQDLPFPEDSNIFVNFEEFRKALIDYYQGKNVESNRKKFLKIDYAIIHDIIGTKTGIVPKDKKPVVTGEPIVAFSKMFLMSSSLFFEKYRQHPTKFNIRIKKIILSDCVDDEKFDSFQNICNFLGGILTFFNDASIESDDTILEFSYDFPSSGDPFDIKNYGEIKDLIKGTGKWGDPSKIEMNVFVSNEQNSRSYEFKWAFSPFSAWANAFSYLTEIMTGAGESYQIPTLIVCNNTHDYIACESSDDFYSRLDQLQATNLYDLHREAIRDCFSNNKVFKEFDLVCTRFKEFALNLISGGLFSSLESLRSLVQDYSVLLKNINDNYSSFTDIQLEKIGLLINCFVLTSNAEILDRFDMGSVIVPAFNPVMLEKIDAKQLFLRNVFSELISEMMTSNVNYRKIENKFDNLIQLSSITQALDVVNENGSGYLACNEMWEYFGVYHEKVGKNELITGNLFANSIVTDDEDASAMLKRTPISNIVIRNTLDYIHTFPSRVDGLNVTFIAPSDMQHIVGAMHAIANVVESEFISATINVRIITINSKKNSSSYLRKWLDSYFDENRLVQMNTYLLHNTIQSADDIDELAGTLRNTDLCFVYNILTVEKTTFEQTSAKILEKDQAKFPMTFTPDPITLTHGATRKVCISQPQFVASMYHTQASFKMGNPHAIPGIYRAFKTLLVGAINKKIVDIAHKECKWVVCIDEAIDKWILESGDKKIIGFSTGEGNYGELNVTVSARSDLLKDIKALLAKRLSEKFYTWSQDRIRKSADYCVDTLSRNVDGSRILKALNPYDYEIHNYLAFLMTAEIMESVIDKEHTILKALISLDSHRHWFDEDEQISDDNTRPDFLLLSIPNTEDNTLPGHRLHIDAKVIECKMVNTPGNEVLKAKTQVEKGLKVLSANWNPTDNNSEHRYWLNQLYRAIIFSPINIPSNDPKYQVIRDKIFGILEGEYEISWTGDILTFWLDSENNSVEEWEVESDVVDDMANTEIDVRPIQCHAYGQIQIQKLLLPPEERNESIVYTPIKNMGKDTENDNVEFVDEPDVKIDEPEETPVTVSLVNPAVSDSSTIPSAKEIYGPFANFLNDKKEHTRQECLEWFGKTFSISSDDKKIVFESNNHPKWETVFDFVISDFRRENLLENSEFGKFHITEKGIAVYKKYCESSRESSIIKLAREYKPSNEDHNEISFEEVKTNDSGEEVVNSVSELSKVRFLLGEEIRSKEKYYWEFGNKELNNRHLLINGNSGCGKTYCIQTLLMEAALQGISSVVFDYTGGFASSKLDPIFKKRLGEKIEQRIVKIKKIPVNPFEKHDIQIDDDIFIPEENADVADKIAETFKSVYAFGDQQRSAVYSAVLSGLKKHGDNMSFPYMVEELEEIGSNYSKTVLSKIQAFTDFNPFALDEKFSWKDIRDSGGTVFVFQLMGYGREIQVLLTELLLWDIWNFSVKNGDESKPFILVLDEAQNLNHGEKSPSAKILTEGRKFGLSGWYATQFMKPQLSDDEIQRLQQAGQKLYFCPPDDGVMTVAKNIDITSAGAKEWSEKLKKLKKGECVTCGNMVKNGKWNKYEPKIIKVTSLQERI